MMTSTTDLAYNALKAQIMSGTLVAGDRVKEELVAEKLGISRTPVRNALQKLAAQGFIVMTHHQGARVADWSSRDLEEIITVRALLEGFGAGVATSRIGPEQLDALTILCDEMEQAAQRATRLDLEQITNLNSRFHMTIIEASGNRRLAEVIGNLAHPLLVQRRFTAFRHEQLQRSMTHHREIVDALALGDSDWASAIMRSHILASASVAT